MLTKPNVIVEQFCALGIPGTDYIIPVQSSVNPDIMTQDAGIPVSMATALTAMGVPVDRAQTNGYMYLYSWYCAWIQFGGTFTFEAAVSTANTGYPAGTVLWAASVSNFVVSLMNNNTSNFVTTPSFINDGIHWSTLSFAAYPDITDSAGVVSITGSLLSILGGANIHNPSTGAQIQIERSANTEAGKIFFIDAENTTSGSAGGTGNPGVIGSGPVTLAFSYNSTDGRPYIPTAIAGIVAATGAVAIYDDITAAKPTTQLFTVNDSAGNSWDLYCTDLTGNGFPSSNFLINAECANYSYLTGTSSRTIDLIGSGIASGSSLYTTGADITFPVTTAYSLFNNFSISIGGTTILIVVFSIGTGSSVDVICAGIFK